MQPAFTLTVGGESRTGVISARLLSLSLSLSTDHASDELTLRLDDRDNDIVAPRRGAVLDLELGYVGRRLFPQGSFIVDGVEPSGPPDVLEIKAKAADMRASLKSPRTRSWRALSIGDVVASIAAAHGLSPAVAPALATIAIEHRDQTGESDLHFLTRLGRDYGAIAAPKAGRLVFAPKGEEVNAAGTTLEPLTFARSDLSRWRGTAEDRSAYGSVRARWRDRAGAVEHYATAGSGDPVRTLRHLYSSQAHAQHAASAEAKDQKLAANKVSFDLASGEPSLFAGRPIQLVGLRPGLAGRWVAAKVDHDLDFGAQGFTTRVEATVSGKAAS